jgi:hypothetical protein
MRGKSLKLRDLDIGNLSSDMSARMAGNSTMHLEKQIERIKAVNGQSGSQLSKG